MEYSISDIHLKPIFVAPVTVAYDFLWIRSERERVAAVGRPTVDPAVDPGQQPAYSHSCSVP